MTDPDTLRSLAAIAAERGGWPDDASDLDEATVKQAREHAAPNSDAHDALTALLSDVRKQAATADGGQPCQ